MSAPVDRNVQREAEAARGLLAQLRVAEVADDAELVADAIEGETGLTEAISAALDEIDECEALESGLKFKEDEFASRRSIIAKRRERIRAAVEQAMVAVDLPTLRLPTGTLTVAKRPAQVIVLNEAEIPSRFWRQPEPPAPKLDKKALADALASEAIPGATLDNGGVSLTIRRK